MTNIRKPDDKEALPPESNTRSGRLRDLVCGGGNWVGDDKIVLIYWSSEDGGRWVMWEDPDPLKLGKVTIGTPVNSDDPD
ncbi:MAG: hypothetical protein GY774_38290 [Planctomycetes bacterium]|nr:hypothetical protein [Planctomycetota bacterium]